MDPTLLAIVGLGAKAFASGMLGFAGSQVAKSTLSESDASRLETLYIEACNDFFDGLGGVAEAEIERLAYFFGAERVAAEVAKWSMQGEQIDAPALRVVWKEQNGEPESLASFLTAFEKAYRARALLALPFELRLGFSLLQSQVATSAYASPSPPTMFSGTSAALESAEERIQQLQTELLRQFEMRLDAAVRTVKEDKAFAAGLHVLRELEGEAVHSAEIRGNSDLMHKLYVNLTVACDRLGDAGGTLHYAEAAIAAKDNDARSLHNLAVTKARVEGGSPEVKRLLDAALSADADHRPAILLRVAILADEEPSEALAEVRRLEWLDSDGAAQYALSSILLRSGDRDGALAAGSKAVELEGSPDQASYLAQLLIQDDLQDGSTVMDFRLRGVSEPDVGSLEKAADLFRRSADEYRRQERVALAEIAETNIARVLMRLGRDHEATPILENLVAKGQTDEAIRTAFANLIEIEIGETESRAIALGEEACSRFPDSDYLHFCFGRALIARGFDKQALDQFSLVSNEETPEQLRSAARLYKALCYINLKDLDSAEQELDQEFEPTALEVNVRLRFLEAKDGLQAAVDWATQLSERHDDDVGVLVATAQFLRRSGFIAEAAPIFSRLLNINTLPDHPTDEQAIFWAQAAYYSGNWEACLGLEATTVTDEQVRTDIQVIQSLALQQLNRHVDALDLLEKLVGEHPTRHDIVEGLTVTCFQLGRPNRAIPHLERLAHSPGATAHDRMNLAILYALAGDIGASLREAEAALSEAPDDRFIITKYIGLMVRGGRTDAAVRQMEAFVQKFPDIDSIQIWRGTPDELTTRLLEEVFLPAKERHEAVADYYSRHPYPIGFMSKLLGRSYTSLWYGIRAGELGRPFQTGRGLESLGDELTAASSSRSMVLDQSALLTLGMLNLISVLPLLFDTIIVPLEAITDIRDELVNHDDDLLRTILADIERHQTTMVVSTSGSGEWAHPETVEALAEQESAAITLGGAHSCPLYSDDLGLRDLAREAGLTTFGTRSVLERAKSEGVIDADSYARAIVGLVQGNYYFVSFNSAVLGFALRESEEAAKSLTSLLDYQDADLRSYARVFSGALCELWSSRGKTGDRTASEWTVQLLHKILWKGGAQLAAPMLVYLVLCVDAEDSSLLRPLMYSISELTKLDDDIVVLLLTFVAFFLAKAGVSDPSTTEAGRHFVDSLGMTWSRRVKAQLRQGAPEEYQILFG